MHDIALLLNAVCGRIRRGKGKQEVRQKPVVHLLLKEAVRREYGIAPIPVGTATQSSLGAHPAEVETEPRYAPAQPEAGDCGTVGADADSGIYAMRGEPVAGDAPGGADRGEALKIP